MISKNFKVHDVKSFHFINLKEMKKQERHPSLKGKTDAAQNKRKRSKRRKKHIKTERKPELHKAHKHQLL